MSRESIRLVGDGLWRNNPGLVQLLGLCPLLAVSNTTINALGLGLATTAVLVASNTIVSAIRRVLRPEIRLPVFVLVIATLVTTVELLIKAFAHGLYLTLGIFVPLIVTNCAILGRAETFARHQPVPRAALDGLAMGAGFGGALLALGTLRELIGRGTLLANAHLLFGERARDWTLVVFPDWEFLLAMLPPGAFIGLGLLIALKNSLDALLAPISVNILKRGTRVQASE